MKSFAIQLEWNQSLSTYKPWMYGTFGVFICNEIFGSPSSPVTLSQLDGWKAGLAHNRRAEPALMTTDLTQAFLSIEGARCGWEHLTDFIPDGFQPLPLPGSHSFQILDVDGLDHCKIFCIEDDFTSRLIYAKDGVPPRECRIPRAVLTNVLLQAIDTLDQWFSELPDPPFKV